MIDQDSSTTRESQPSPPASTAVLTAGGLLAALGAASCCALPAIVGAAGVGASWLTAIASVAGPLRPELAGAAILCLVGGGLLPVLRRRGAARCAAGAPCHRRVLAGLTAGAWALGAGLTALSLFMA